VWFNNFLIFEKNASNFFSIINSMVSGWGGGWLLGCSSYFLEHISTMQVFFNIFLFGLSMQLVQGDDYSLVIQW
jgi:hypothetical protein